MLSTYAKLSSHLLAVLEREREREREAVNMQESVFTLAILKIVPSYHQELVSHPMPEHIEALMGDYTIYYRNLNTFVAIITFFPFLLCRYF